MSVERRRLQYTERYVSKHFGCATRPAVSYSALRGGRVVRRKTMTTAVIATNPYSSSMIQPGSTNGRPSVRRCQTMYVGIMLTVQTMIGSVETDRTNGRSQSKYHGNAAGAQKSDAAIGHANASADHPWDLTLNQIATRTPTRTASPTTNCGAATRRRAAKTGSLKPKPS